MTDEWTSLEVAKLSVGVLTPVVVVVLGVMVQNAARRIENAQWSARKLIERRIELYDQMAGPLNDLFVFFRMRGHFREICPDKAITTKRDVDKAFYANRFLMSTEFDRLYHAFIATCFLQGQEIGHDAKLRSWGPRQKRERDERPPWKECWDDLFVDDESLVPTMAELEHAYEALMQRFAAECGVTREDVESGGQPRQRSSPSGVRL